MNAAHRRRKAGLLEVPSIKQQVFYFYYRYSLQKRGVQRRKLTVRKCSWCLAVRYTQMADQVVYNADLVSAEGLDIINQLASAEFQTE